MICIGLPRFGSKISIQSVYANGKPVELGKRNTCLQAFDSALLGKFPYKQDSHHNEGWQFAFLNLHKDIRPKLLQQLIMMDPDFAALPVARVVTSMEGDDYIVTGKDVFLHQNPAKIESTEALQMQSATVDTSVLQRYLHQAKQSSQHVDFYAFYPRSQFLRQFSKSQNIPTVLVDKMTIH